MDEPILPAAGAIVAVCAHIAPSTPLDEVAHLVARPAVCVDLDGLQVETPHVALCLACAGVALSSPSVVGGSWSVPCV